MINELMKSAAACADQPADPITSGLSATDPWLMKTQGLRFAVASVTFFTLTFRAWVRNADFLAASPDLADCPPPLHRMNSQTRWAIARSQPVQAPLPRIALLPQVVRYVPRQYRRYVIDLQGSFADYLKKFSSKSRSTLTRKVRKFAELSGGRLHWQEFHTPEQMPDFHRLARELSRKTYQEKLLDEGLPQSEEFLRGMTELAARDCARAYLLFFQGRPVAYLYCPIEMGVLRYAYQGFDPELWKSSPGTVLQYLALESIFAEQKFRFFDFTEGEGPTKQFFATGCVHCADVYYLRRNLRNLLIVLAHAATEAASAFAGKLADKLRVRTHIRHLLRFRNV